MESSLGRPSINACYEAASIAYSQVISLVIMTHLGYSCASSVSRSRPKEILKLP